MPSIRITDTSGIDVGSVSPDPGTSLSSLVKYAKTQVLNFVLLPGLVKVLSQPLVAASETPINLGFGFSDEVALGTSEKEITFGAGSSQTVNVNTKLGSNLFTDDLYGSAVPVGAGEGYLSLALKGTVDANPIASGGDLSFGFDAGGGITTEFFRRFTVDAAKPTVGDALTEVISGFILPAKIADLDAMEPGDIAIVSGSGSLKLSGDVTVSASANPLASPKLPLIDEAVEVQAGASIDLGASFELSGSYQIRARKLSDHSVELGYYRKKGEQWSVSATASAGAGVAFAGTELLEKLIDAVSSKPQADRSLLTGGGLTGDEIDQIQDEIAKSIDHSLKASLDLEVSVAPTDEAAFLYRIDTSSLDDVSAAAVHAALKGNLAKLTALEKNDDGHGKIAEGVAVLRSILTKTRDRAARLKVNLVGLLNFSSVSELIQKSQVVYEPVTGDLTINETVSGTRIEDLVLPRAQEKLRKLKFDSLLITTAYRASKSMTSMDVTSSDVFFAFNNNTNEHTMSDYLDGMLGLGLVNADLKRQLLAGFHGTGTSTCQLRVEFGDKACEAMFLAEGRPRPQLEYETIGRSVLQTLLQPPPGDTKDVDAYRREVLANDDIWKKLKAAGQPGFGTVLPALAGDAVRLNTIRSDYTEIMWWARSMASTAQKLFEMRSFIETADPGTLRGNNKFIEKRKDLQKHVAGVVANSGLEFGLPFGLVALYQAAKPLAVPHGIITSSALTRSFSRAAGASQG
jgi:hypothetical protein